MTDEKLAESLNCEKFKREVEILHSRLKFATQEVSQIQSTTRNQTVILSQTCDRQRGGIRHMEQAHHCELEQQHQKFAQSEGRVAVLENRAQLLQSEVNALKTELDSCGGRVRDANHRADRKKSDALLQVHL